MKRVLLFSFCLVLITSMAFAQAGSIGAFADTGGLICNLNNISGAMQVQCVHIFTPGATGCQFSVGVLGMPLTYVGDMSPFPMVIGNSQTGVAIAYGQCLVSPIHVLTVFYMGVSPACDWIVVLPDPTASPPGIYVTDCTLPIPNLLVATGGVGKINGLPNLCPCNIPSEDTSWGQIKSLYQ